MKRKIQRRIINKEWRIIFILLFIIFSFFYCKRKLVDNWERNWIRNPNLELLISNDTLNFIFPVWSVSKKVYFIATKGVGGYTQGNIWVINEDGKESKVILAGRYMHYDVTPDGSKIVMLIGENHSRGNCCILISDTSGNILDSFLVPGYSYGYDSRVRVGKTTGKIYYLINNPERGYQIRRINQDGTGDELLLDVADPYFALSPAETLLLVGSQLVNLHTGKTKKSDLLNSVFLNDVQVVGVKIKFSNNYFYSDLYVCDISTDSIIPLNASPYPPFYGEGGTVISSLYPSPSGDKIVFSIGRYCEASKNSLTPPAVLDHFELWVLNKISLKER